MSSPHAMDVEDTWQIFLGLVRVGTPFGLACRKVGITRRAMSNYLQDRPTRAAEFLEVEYEATEAIEAVLYEEAKAHQKWAVQLWLERRDKDRWGPQADAQGPAKIVLDPAALKGMLVPAVTEATVVEEHGLPGPDSDA